MARWSSRSKPRRLGISSRKSVSAAASSSATRRSACVSLVRRLRMVALLPSLLAPLPIVPAVALVAALAAPAWDERRGARARLVTTFVRLPLVFPPFLAFAAVALFGFFMGILLNEGLRGFTKTG